MDGHLWMESPGSHQKFVIFPMYHKSYNLHIQLHSHFALQVASNYRHPDTYH